VLAMSYISYLGNIIAALTMLPLTDGMQYDRSHCTVVFVRSA
jgi:hypothetical protein